MFNPHKKNFMKQAFIIKLFKESCRQLVVSAGLLLFVSLPNGLMAQADTTTPPAVDTTAAPAVEEEAELISPSLEFKGVQKGDNSIDLKTALKAKVKGQVINLYKMKVSFYQVMNEEDVPLGFAITDGNGKAVFTVKGDSLKTNAEGKMLFKAQFAGNKAMEAAEEVAEFKRARLEMTPVKEDSLLTVQVKLVEPGTGTETPVKEATVGIYVKRLFLPQKIGEITTDENGEGSLEFPNGVPGDAKGNLTLMARLDENEVYGNLETASVQPWGLPVSDKPEDQPRALWSSHPPIWMLITFIVLMLAVWGHYVVIVYELFRLRKEQPNMPTHATNS
jgi:hypothetical protein